MMTKNSHIMKLPSRLISSEFKKIQKKKKISCLNIFCLTLANANLGPGSICKKLEKKKKKDKDRLQQ